MAETRPRTAALSRSKTKHPVTLTLQLKPPLTAQRRLTSGSCRGCPWCRPLPASRVVNRDARDHIGLLARQPGETLGEKKDGLAHSDLHCLFEIRIEPHHHPVGRCFGARPSEFHVFAHDERELTT